MSNDFDYGEDGQNPEEAKDALARLSKLAEEQVKAERDVKRLEEDLKKAQENLIHISEVQIPTLMDEVGIKKYVTTSGLPVEIKETMRAGITKEKNCEAIAWLDEHGLGNVVMRSYSIEFNKDEADEAKRFAEMATAQNFRVAPSNTVHWMTLASLIKEQLAKGVDIPMDLFGAYQQRKAKVG